MNLRFLLILCVLAFTSRQSSANSLSSFAARAEKHEALTVVFFGGSLTFGANASDPDTTSYRGRMMRWLREKYPRTPFHFRDAAIGGTGSQLGMFRLEKDVLSQKPDLVFLDFTVNDGSEETDVQSLASYERIVRELLANDVAVMPVIMLFKWHAEKPGVTPPRHVAHLKLAETYGLPAADVCSHVQNKVGAGAKTSDIWNMGDGAHPGDEGYAMFFEAVRDRFEAAVQTTPSKVIPEKPVFDDLYQKRFRTLVAGHLPENWKMQKTRRTALWFDGMASRWMGDVATASAEKKSGALEMKFHGSMVGIFGERDGLTPPIKVWINGKPVAPPKAADGDFLWKLDTTRFAPAKKGSGNLFLWQPLAKGLPDGEHTLRIEPVWESADKDAELRIESVCSAGR